MKFIDLHLHSTCSDGTMTPEELVEEARRLNIAAISITDHDTVEGTDDALKAGKEKGIEIISGVEISAYLDEVPLHILGYGFRHSSVTLQKKLQKVQEARRERNREILENINNLGIPITTEELAEESGGGQAGRPHIAALLIRKKIVRCMDEAFARYLRTGGLAYAERARLMAEDAIAMIREAEGVAILAHPLTIDRSGLALESCLKKLRDQGLAGAEAYYPVYSAADRRKITNLCLEMDLLITGGSDFHGAIRNGTRLGGHSKQRVPYELFEKLKKRLEQFSPDDA